MMNVMPILARHVERGARSRVPCTVIRSLAVAEWVCGMLRRKYRAHDHGAQQTVGKGIHSVARLFRRCCGSFSISLHTCQVRLTDHRRAPCQRRGRGLRERTHQEPEVLRRLRVMR